MVIPWLGVADECMTLWIGVHYSVDRSHGVLKFKGLLFQSPAVERETFIALSFFFFISK